MRRAERAAPRRARMPLLLGVLAGFQAIGGLWLVAGDENLGGFASETLDGMGLSDVPNIALGLGIVSLLWSLLIFLRSRLSLVLMRIGAVLGCVTGLFMGVMLMPVSPVGPLAIVMAVIYGAWYMYLRSDSVSEFFEA
jgi:hypothetical protein